MYVPPKSPSGGGFSAELFSLQYLYEEHKFHRNIWTKTNLFKDLCRYLKCTFTFYRHPERDFIVSYERQPPFPLNKFAYTAIHPQQMLLSKHKKLILSTLTKPNGKTKTRLTIKPPKQMITKWFFTHHFASYNLLLLKGTVADFRYSNLGCCNYSQQSNLFYLNLQFYRQVGWGNTVATQTTPYQPFNTPSFQTINYTFKGQQKTTSWENPKTYNQSVSLNKGWFSVPILNATSFQPPNGALPIAVGRYNPATDDGYKNKLYLVSIVRTAIIQPTDPVLFYENLPLWLMLYGYLNYVLQTKKDKRFLDTYYIVFECPSIYRYNTTHTSPQIIPIDESMMLGLAAWKEDPTQTQQTQWYPTVLHQLETINQIVQTGPYIPKLDNQRNSTWELDYFYSFHFKWGGPEITDPTIINPHDLQDYDVPDHLKKAVQICNPRKQIPASYLHPWDSRRGFITQRALKRMSENQETDTDFYSDTGSTPKKKKRATAQMQHPDEENKEVKACLQALFEEPTCQEIQKEDLQLYIQQQQQQQFELKRNLLKLLTELKENQKILQLQTGIL